MTITYNIIYVGRFENRWDSSALKSEVMFVSVFSFCSSFC